MLKKHTLALSVLAVSLTACNDNALNQELVNKVKETAKEHLVPVIKENAEKVLSDIFEVDTKNGRVSEEHPAFKGEINSEEIKFATVVTEQDKKKDDYYTRTIISQYNAVKATGVTEPKPYGDIHPFQFAKVGEYKYYDLLKKYFDTITPEQKAKLPFDIKDVYQGTYIDSKALIEKNKVIPLDFKADIESANPNIITVHINDVKVLDGDTISFRQQGDPKDKFSGKVRLAGIDAPEKAMKFGMPAKQALQMCIEKPLHIEGALPYVHIAYMKKDGYGRAVGHIYSNWYHTNNIGKNMPIHCNTEILRNGLAWYYRQYKENVFTAHLSDNSPIDVTLHNGANITSAQIAQGANLLFLKARQPNSQKNPIDRFYVAIEEKAKGSKGLRLGVWHLMDEGQVVPAWTWRKAMKNTKSD